MDRIQVNSPNLMQIKDDIVARISSRQMCVSLLTSDVKAGYNSSTYIPRYGSNTGYLKYLMNISYILTGNYASSSYDYFLFMVLMRFIFMNWKSFV